VVRPADSTRTVEESAALRASAGLAAETMIAEATVSPREATNFVEAMRHLSLYGRNTTELGQGTL
jgi:hypothetical protein